MHLTAARPNYVPAAELSANFFTNIFTLKPFYWCPCVLWAQPNGNSYLSTDHTAII